MLKNSVSACVSGEFNKRKKKTYFYLGSLLPNEIVYIFFIIFVRVSHLHNHPTTTHTVSLGVTQDVTLYGTRLQYYVGYKRLALRPHSSFTGFRLYVYESNHKKSYTMKISFKSWNSQEASFSHQILTQSLFKYR